MLDSAQRLQEELWEAGRRSVLIPRADDAELLVETVAHQSLEWDVAGDTGTGSEGVVSSGDMRLWEPRGCRFASWELTGGQTVEQLGVAASAVAPADLGPPPPLPDRDSLPPQLPLSASHTLIPLAQALTAGMRNAGAVVQNVLVQRLTGWTQVHRRERSASDAWSSTRVFLRCETRSGAVVHSTGWPQGHAEPSVEWVLRPLLDAVDCLSSEGADLPRGLPLLLRPPVAIPLVAALGQLFQAHVAAASSGFLRALGQRLFPTSLQVLDMARHPDGIQARTIDDEGRSTRDVTLVEHGTLRSFLHTTETAAALQGVPSGRAFREGMTPSRRARSLNFHVAPGSTPLPTDFVDLDARIEMFTAMPRAGVVTMMAGGWEVREGARIRRVRPVELTLPVLTTLRQLRGVGADLMFFPAWEDCGSPSLLFESLPEGASG